MAEQGPEIRIRLSHQRTCLVGAIRHATSIRNSVSGVRHKGIFVDSENSLIAEPKHNLQGASSDVLVIPRTAKRSNEGCEELRDHGLNSPPDRRSLSSLPLCCLVTKSSARVRISSKLNYGSNTKSLELFNVSSGIRKRIPNEDD